ncbi:RidA family protein [Desulfitobacterium sp.]|uniref:RidA family protein n=1 Tax=Desulfitobacterium sp. TaxID=49981 RepID=UPI002B213988|nr:RidA family protein [Desulfitobacterium sp.]MEA4900354.1 RidA family protein [Desulfitobacterium sp.]
MLKKSIQTGKAPAAIGPYSQGILAEKYLFVSGQLPLDPVTGVLPEDIKSQTAQSIKNVQAVLQAAGGDLANIIKTTVFLTDMKDFNAVNGVYAAFMKENPPARSAVQVAALPKGAHVEIEAIAYI